MADVVLKVNAPDTKPISLSRLPDINEEPWKEQSYQLREIVVLEKPDGKVLTLRVINTGDDNSKRIEIVTRPHRGLTKEQIEKAQELIKRDSHMALLFQSVPIPKYYLHTVFYGKPFSEAPYSSTNFSIIALEHSGRVADYEAYKHLIFESALSIHEIPMMYRGRPNLAQIEKLKSTSVLSHDGVGHGCYVMGSPLYHPETENLMFFKVEA